MNKEFNLVKTYKKVKGIHLMWECEEYSTFLLVEPEGECEIVNLHHHKDWDESWYIIAGYYDCTIGENRILLNSGDFLSVKKNIPHKLIPTSKECRRIAIFKKGVEIEYED